MYYSHVSHYFFLKKKGKNNTKFMFWKSLSIYAWEKSLWCFIFFLLKKIKLSYYMEVRRKIFLVKWGAKDFAFTWHFCQYSHSHILEGNYQSLYRGNICGIELLCYHQHVYSWQWSERVFIAFLLKIDQCVIMDETVNWSNGLHSNCTVSLNVWTNLDPSNLNLRLFHCILY